MGIVIPDRAKRVMEALEEAGFEAFMVGGAVRDAMLGRPISDVDITTNATTSQVTETLEKKGLAVHPTGVKHGTVTAVLEGEPFEVTTYRVDGTYSDSRHPDKVEFSQNIEDDLSRRDFTINAMAYNEKRGLVDPYGGEKDLADHVIRCVGDPERRFSEDALRIMRALRFSSQLAFEIDKPSSDALVEMRGLLENISSERIGIEFEKLVCGKWASKVIGRYVDVILVLIPEMEPMIGLDTHSELHIYDVWEHTLVALENQRSNDPVTRMATLFHDTGKTIVNDPTKGAFRFAGHAEASGKICRQVLRRLKFPRKFIDECSLVISSHDLRFEDTNYSVRKWMGELGAETFFRVVDLKRADICAHNPEIARDAVAKMDRIRECAQQALDNGDCYKVSDLEISGADLMEIGFEKGPEIGETLTWILDEVMRGVCDNDKDKLLELARARLLTSGRNQGD